MDTNIENKYVDAIITSIQKYGFFVNFKLDNKLASGFVHISECEHGYIESNKTMNKLEKGLKVKLEIIEYQANKNRYLLSLKNIDKTCRCNNFLHVNKHGFIRLKNITNQKINNFVFKDKE